MKRRTLAVILLAAAVFMSLSACGAKSAAESCDAACNFSYAPDEPEVPAPGQAAEDRSGEQKAFGISGGKAAVDAEKIVYSGYAEVETKDFDKSVEEIARMIASVNGFIENSSLTGSNYSGGRDCRSASYTIRIPADKFKSVSDSLSEIGNVIYLNTNAENITTQYYDTQSRLNAYRIEDERLTEMLKKAETVEDMLSIESRMSEVRFNIESLVSEMNRYESQLSYSTLSITLTEVKNLTNAQGMGASYWEEMRAGLESTLVGVWDFLKDLGLFIVAALPVIIILAAVAAVVVVIVRRRRRKKAAARLQASAGTSGEEKTEK